MKNLNYTTIIKLKEIYEHIKHNQCIPKHNPSEKTKMAYYCKILKEQGLVENHKNGVWKINSSSNFDDLNRHTTNEAMVIRSHGYEFQIGIPYLVDWEHRTKLFDKFKVSYKNIPQGQIIKIRRHNVYLYDDSVRVTFKKGTSYISNDPELGNNIALNEFKATLRSLQTKIRTNLSFGKGYKIKCHHAHLNNEIADWHIKRGYTNFIIKDNKGEAWLMMDQSCNLLELETIHPKSSTSDMKTVVQPLMNKLKDNPYILDHIEEALLRKNKEIESLLELTSSQTKMMVEQQKQIIYLTNKVFGKDYN